MLAAAANNAGIFGLTGWEELVAFIAILMALCFAGWVLFR